MFITNYAYTLLYINYQVRAPCIPEAIMKKRGLGDYSAIKSDRKLVSVFQFYIDYLLKLFNIDYLSYKL